MSSSERLLGAAIVEHLCEVERRALHLDVGFGSLFTYCTEQLGFSVDVAFKRVKELSLSSVVVMASHRDDLDETEGDGLVEAARGKSKRDVERMIAERFPDAGQPRGGELRLQMSERFEELLQEARDLERDHGY